MKLAIVGNSHIGALKRGWDEQVCRAFPEVSLTFFGARNSMMSGLLVEGDRLLPGTPELAAAIAFTSNGCASIRPVDFDLILAIGMCAGADQQVQNFAGPYSQAARLFAMVDFWGKSNLLKLLDKIREISDVPIYAGAAPLPAARDEAPLPMAVYRDFAEAVEAQVFSLLDVAFVPQPEATLAHGGATIARFAKGSARLEVGLENDGQAHRTGEANHMNAEFGVIWLEAFLNRVCNTKKAAPIEAALS